MNKIVTVLFVFSLIMAPEATRAQESGEQEVFDEASLEGWPPPSELLSNNTGPLAAVSGETTANISAGSEAVNQDLAGALQGEITIRQAQSDSDVYANGIFVEKLINGMGQTGEIVSSTSGGKDFQPKGRPVLHCPPQNDAPGWYGPCKVDEVMNSDESSGGGAEES